MAEVEAWFRDTYVDADGAETVVHEYEVQATVDRASRRFVRREAVPGPLPYIECPGCGDERRTDWSANPSTACGTACRPDFTGPSTCTHLNDALRSLEGVDHILTTLERQGAAMTNVVIGAGSGMGVAVAHALADRGDLLVADRDLAAVEAVAEDLGGHVTPMACDVTDEAQVAALVERIDDPRGPGDHGRACPGRWPTVAASSR